MTLLYSFLFCGTMCLIGQIILDNTKLTPGHVTSILVVFGAFLGMLDIYDKFIDMVGAGATIPITSFGNGLFNGAYKGYLSSGFLGIFNNMLANGCVGIATAVIFSFFFSLISKPRD